LSKDPLSDGQAGMLDLTTWFLNQVTLAETLQQEKPGTTSRA
jgi:hypothetical protein